MIIRSRARESNSRCSKNFFQFDKFRSSIFLSQNIHWRFSKNRLAESKIKQLVRALRQNISYENIFDKWCFRTLCYRHAELCGGHNPVRERGVTVYICPLENPTTASARLVTILVISKKTESDKKVDSSNKKGGGWCPQAYYFLVKLHLYSDTYQSNLFCLLCKNVGYISITYSIMLNRRPAV